MSLSQEECKDILCPLLRATLPKARINRNFSRNILQAPGGLMGLELPCLYASQVVNHIECLLRYGGSNTFTGQLLKEALEAAKAEAGIPGALLSQPFDKYGDLITHSWIKEV